MKYIFFCSVSSCSAPPFSCLAPFPSSMTKHPAALSENFLFLPLFHPQSPRLFPHSAAMVSAASAAASKESVPSPHFNAHNAESIQPLPVILQIRPSPPEITFTRSPSEITSCSPVIQTVQRYFFASLTASLRAFSSSSSSELSTPPL